MRVLEKYGNGLSRDEVLDVVQDFVTQNRIITKFKGDRPGPDWFIGFRQRHQLSIKKPQAVEYARKDAVRPNVILPYLKQLDGIFLEYDLFNKPHVVFNVDETSFSHDPSKTKVVGAIGAPCTRTISSCGRENTSVLVGASASGFKLPLLIIFKGQNVMEDWIDIEKDQITKYSPRVDDTAVAASENGWMLTEIFFN